jgi:putative phage-type endonuclease
MTQVADQMETTKDLIEIVFGKASGEPDFNAIRQALWLEGGGVDVDAEQGSFEWHCIRSDCFTASEVAAFVGLAKFGAKSPEAVIALKRGGGKVQTMTHHMSRGVALEGVAREMVEEHFLHRFPASTRRRGLVLASPDGWDEETKTVLEIKCPSKEFSTGVPAHYLPQIMQQAWVYGAERLIYAEYIGGMLQVWVLDGMALAMGWANHIAPVLCEWAPYLTDPDLPLPGLREDDEEWCAAAARYIECKTLADEAERLLESAKGDLLALISEGDAPRLTGGGVEVLRSERKGNVNWKAKPLTEALAAAGVDPEQYRGKSTTVTTIKIVGGE